MLTLIVFFAFFHHHHHKPVPPPPVATVDPLESPDPDRPCIMLDGLFEFDGFDGASGFSKTSCEAAYNVWQNTPPPPAHLSI